MNEHRPGDRPQDPAYSPPSLSRRRQSPFARVLPAPRRLARGDRVAVVAGSGPVDRAKLERGLGLLTELGLEPVVGPHVLERSGYLAGRDDERRADLQLAIDDPSTVAVLFARGGYGLTRIVDGLVLDGLREHRKLVLGFSDITAFQLAASGAADVACVYGPMVASNLARRPPDERTLAALASIVGPGDARPLVLGGDHGLRVTGPTARVTAAVVGGCLSLLQASLGTPLEIGTRGGILFWEDVGEDLYRLDRMLTHMRLAGKLAGLAGMIVGVGVGITRERRQDRVDDLTEFLAEWLGEVDYPVVTQFPCGHGEPCVALPLGRLVTIDGGAGTVEIPPLPEGQ